MNPFVEWVKALRTTPDGKALAPGEAATLERFAAHRAAFGETWPQAMRHVLEALLGLPGEGLTESAATVLGVDVSNYTGELSVAQAKRLREAGYEHVVVRLSLEDERKRTLAVRQLRACADAGLTVSGYAWSYWDWSPVETVERSLAIAQEAGVELGTLWLDAEDPKPEHCPAVGTIVGWLRTAANRALELGVRVGIYTGRWWWEPATGNSPDLADLPLWAAQYDGVSDLERWTPYGGWTRLAGKQYAGTSSVAGVENVDLNVFRFEVTKRVMSHG